MRPQEPPLGHVRFNQSGFAQPEKASDIYNKAN